MQLIDAQRAWAPYQPGPDRPWGLRQAGHLFRRAGFGASWPELQRAVAEGPERTVERLIRPSGDVDSFHRAIEADEWGSAAAGSVGALRAWWLRRMILSPHPLLEKMTLFWHGSFATGEAGPSDAQLMRQHVQLLRTHALGRMDRLLSAVLEDPAVLLWLEAPANRKAAPNAHFGRAVLECFTVGPGAFSETDVNETARALTGWFVLMKQTRFIPREHDAGPKRVLGHEGPFGKEELVRLLVAQPATSRHMARRLYRWFISETAEPDENLLVPLAEMLAKDYDIGRAVETILRSNLFFSPAAYRQRVKSPVEFAVGLVRGLEGMVATAPLADELAGLGQELYRPPTVHGWAGGRYWINRATLLGRANLASRMLSGGQTYGDHLDPAATVARYAQPTPKAAAGLLLELFLEGDVPPAVREQIVQAAHELASGAASNGAVWMRQLTHLVVTLPEFHLA